MTSPRRLTLVALLAVVAVLPVACSAAGAPTGATPTPSPSPTASTQAPDAPVSTRLPLIPGSGGPSDPGARRVVVPKPGQLDVHPVPAQTLSATVDGRHVIVTIDYTSGVEPCNILDSIAVKPGVGSFEVTLEEGHGPDLVACPEIAQFKRATVDLGDVAPGTYRISDGTGVAAPISVAVA